MKAVEILAALHLPAAVPVDRRPKDDGRRHAALLPGN